MSSAIDPWGFDTNDGKKQIDAQTENERSISKDVSSSGASTLNSFGDDFVDNLIQKNSQSNDNIIKKQDISSLAFEPLTDSREYLDRLELKLQKLQKVSLQKALSERRSDEARRLLDARLQSLELSAVTSQHSESIIEEEVEDNAILRRLCPDRQAVNISELQKLLDADSLQKLVEEVADCEGETREKSQESHNVAEIDKQC